MVLDSIVSGGPVAASKAVPENKELKKACQDFESVFVFQLLKQMRETVKENETFSGGNGGKMFQGLLDMNYAQQVAQKGDGLGIGKMLYEYFNRANARKAYEGNGI